VPLRVPDEGLLPPFPASTTLEGRAYGMLPGLRILFAITLLSVSVLIFGLGAAAYLRSAHDHFANAPWRPIEAPATARVDLAPATIAMLRVEPEATSTTPLRQPDVMPEVSTATEPLPVAAAVESAPPRTEPTVAAIATQPITEAAPALPASVSESLAQPAHETTVAPVAAAAPEAAIAPPPAETVAADTKPAEPIVEAKEAAPAPIVVAALPAEQLATKDAAPAASAAAAPAETSPVVETAASLPAAATPVGDTLIADDRTFEAPAKVAAVGEPSVAAAPPLPSKEVKIPTPRTDPAVIEARRKRLIAEQQQKARARAAQARRVAAARARAAAQPKTTDPFASPFGATKQN
jgi:hypothetical protein